MSADEAWKDALEIAKVLRQNSLKAESARPEPNFISHKGLDMPARDIYHDSVKNALRNETIFDRDTDRDMVVSIGWQKVKRIHGCLIHIDIINDKVWIQRDGTEDGIAYELEAAGIPKKQIVLGFYRPEVRPHTEYAAA